MSVNITCWWLDLARVGVWIIVVRRVSCVHHAVGVASVQLRDAAIRGPLTSDSGCVGRDVLENEVSGYAPTCPQPPQKKYPPNSLSAPKTQCPALHRPRWYAW